MLDVLPLASDHRIALPRFPQRYQISPHLCTLRGDDDGYDGEAGN